MGKHVPQGELEKWQSRVKRAKGLTKEMESKKLPSKLSLVAVALHVLLIVVYLGYFYGSHSYAPFAVLSVKINITITVCVEQYASQLRLNKSDTSHSFVKAA